MSANSIICANARKAKAEQEAARLKIMQRKERTRRLIEIGGLAVKAGIDDLPASALYDRFLAIADAAKEPDAVTKWEHAGSRSFHEEESARVVAIAKFTGKIEPELAATLRSVGFRWNRFLKQWEGKVPWPKPPPSSRARAGRSPSPTAARKTPSRRVDSPGWGSTATAGPRPMGAGGDHLKGRLTDGLASASREKSCTT